LVENSEKLAEEVCSWAAAWLIKGENGARREKKSWTINKKEAIFRCALFGILVFLTD
jgi:hypothetical protein